MGVEYQSIDSQCRDHEMDSSVNIYSARPIDTESLRMISFSTANELYNVQEGNDTFVSPSYNCGHLKNPPAMFTATTDPGFYRAMTSIDRSRTN